MPSRPLVLPLEILYEILRLAFLPDGPPSPTPEPLPPRSTSHLLLVSRSIRQLCLPFFWHSVTIAQPSDWITLFGRRTGLLVAGKAGRQRWSLVHTLYVHTEALPPVALGKFSTHKAGNRSLADSSLLSPLELPTFRQLPRLIFHATAPSWRDRIGHDRFAAEAERQKLFVRVYVVVRARLTSLALAPVPAEGHIGGNGGERWEHEARSRLDGCEAGAVRRLNEARGLLLADMMRALLPLKSTIPTSYWTPYEYSGGEYGPRRISQTSDVEDPVLPTVEFVYDEDDPEAADAYMLLFDLYLVMCGTRCHVRFDWQGRADKERESMEGMTDWDWKQESTSRTICPATLGWTKKDGSEFLYDSKLR